MTNRDGLGFPLLTEEQKGILLAEGYVLDKNVFGDDIAMRPNGFGWFNRASWEWERRTTDPKIPPGRT